MRKEIDAWDLSLICFTLDVNDVEFKCSLIEVELVFPQLELPTTVFDLRVFYPSVNFLATVQKDKNGH